MRIRAVVLLVTTLFLAVGAVAPPAIAAPNPISPRNTTGEPIPDQYLVTMNTGYDPHEIVNRLGITPLFVYSTAIIGFAAKLTPLQLTLLRKAPGVASIEQDVTAHQQYTPQAPSRAVSSWGLDRINQRALPLDGTYTPAHDGANVTVYIIDTGIDYAHSEFGGRATFGYDAIGDGKGAPIARAMARTWPARSAARPMAWPGKSSWSASGCWTAPARAPGRAFSPGSTGSPAMRSNLRWPTPR
jgi:subtilisin family serine protease